MSSPPPCRFHTTRGGCNRGRSCRFSHGDTSGSSQRPASPVIGPSGRGASRAEGSNAPPGVCSFFWKTGNCVRGFQCRYKHQANPAVDKVDSKTQAPAMRAIAPFLTTEALARVSGAGTDGYFSDLSSLSPSEVHNNLKTYLYDNFRFRTAQNVYAFLALIGNANSGNVKWAPEDGQLLLSAIGTGNGILRLNDIVAWSEVSISPSNKLVLSFQRGYLPLLRYLSSDFVVKSITSQVVNALYTLVMHNFDHFTEVIEKCIADALTSRKSFKDPSIPPSASTEPLGSQVFASLAKVLFEYLTRFKNAVATHPSLHQFVLNFHEWSETWIAGVSSTPATFHDPLADASVQARDFIIQRLRAQVEQLVAIVERKHREVERAQGRIREVSVNTTTTTQEGILAALENGYEGPGNLRPQGPRHDNDFADIANIRIAPTHDELASRHDPFLPANIFGAPHPLFADSMERLLDIQFRLLREELTASLRTSTQLVVEDLQEKRRATRLDDLMKKGGGKYRGHVAGQDTIMFNVYTNVDFSPFTPDRRGLSVGVSLDAPPGRARSNQSRARIAFWESMSSKRLMQGGLVALIWQQGGSIDVHLGTIASSLRDLTASAGNNSDRIAIRVSFFDPEVQLRILQELRLPKHERRGVRLMVEATVMFESVRPFLEALRMEPESVPFSRYLVLRPPDFLKTVQISPPAYALLPSFTFELSSLFPSEAGIDNLKLSVQDPQSVEAARDALRKNSRLDPSQADSVIEALTRELVLIQGPPGTGKSYTGVELLRVLLANGAGPVLMIAFTNHALDHMLRSVLDANITRKIVRLGSRSADERIAEFSLENVEKVNGKSRLDRAFSAEYRALRDVEEEITRFMQESLKTGVDSEQIRQYLRFQSPTHFESLSCPPRWIQTLYSLSASDRDNGAWQRVPGRGGKVDTSDDSSLYAYWRTGQDLEFVQSALYSFTHPDPPPAVIQQPVLNRYEVLAPSSQRASAEPQADSEESSEEDDDDEAWDIAPEEAWELAPIDPDTIEDDSMESEIEVEYLESIAPSNAPPDTGPPSPEAIKPTDFADIEKFFHTFGCAEIPRIPSSQRPSSELLEEDDIWTMSLREREQLHRLWTDEVRVSLQATRTDEFQRLRDRHTTALRNYNEGKDEIRRQMLRNVDIIGCTTTGAAKLTALLKGIGPRVMLVEEAGQVLEAHVLGSLVPSIQHLILIGDPLQLRPTLNNYSLSMDHRRGRMLFKFDMSLMERLATSGLPMSQINVQRRMRPEIADLVRNTLYPKLEDHDLVKVYPSVKGMAKNVFFMTHNHKENGGEDDFVSKYNTFEVEMIKDLVLYLLRQGSYSAEGDIVVLCAYLGQLSKLRDILSNEVAVVIDERDQAELNERDAEREDVDASMSTVEHVKVSRRVLLRTIDNYQGEEAKIIILSLVRNAGGSEEDDAVYGHSSNVRPNIGFLKSENRTNVALSRAREGLYILGNATNLASRSSMWRTVLEELGKEECLGDAFPVICQRHPNNVEEISRPGQLPMIAPDGGCLLQCDMRLNCGHLCPYKCHSDDPKHLAVACVQRCTRLCPRGHPCAKPCADPCGKCLTPVSNVELPCGHVKSTVYCYQLDDLSEVSCSIAVTRRLPQCEHDASMMCSDDPARFICRVVCNGVMSCCGRSCKAQCHQCRQLNTTAQPDDEEVAQHPVERLEHLVHPCERSLFCGHRCGKPCSKDHECVTVCKGPCRQVCRHASCRNYCSTPCAPCQEPCTWRCSHYTCPVPCGAVCARLPCDKRCERTLACGHRCPSVCGEDCIIQICPLCAPEEVQNSVVDLILQRTLADIDPDSDALDEIIITLPNCRHVFTVETLDGHCEMTEYYKCDSSDGKWLSLEAPPVGFKNPPACPTCRSAITSPRYGRIFKRADLDILENNVAFYMSQLLKTVYDKMDLVSKADLENRLAADAINLSVAALKSSVKELKAKQKSKNAILNATRVSPVAVQDLDLSNQRLHGLPASEAKAFKRVLNRLLAAYSDTVVIARTRSAHSHAWEASFAYLYQKEMDDAASDPARAPRNPHEHAMRMARLKVGQPQPRADKRFLVEAFWTTITIRLTLADFAGKWLEALAKRAKYPPENRRMWATYISFLLRSCAVDARIAYGITEESESHRQKARTSLLLMRVELEQFRFNVTMTRQNGNTGEGRNNLADSAKSKSAEASKYAAGVIAAHQQARRVRQTPGEEDWLTTDFSRPAKVILDEWRALERSLRSDTFYEPVSLEELTEIVKGLNFSHTGHFYKCPNGHVFVITECGGANERSICRECGEPIGGTGHSLLPTNTRATELEEIARAQGSHRSPWAWGV